jgi:hypothetical protein
MHRESQAANIHMASSSEGGFDNLAYALGLLAKMIVRRRMVAEPKRQTAENDKTLGLDENWETKRKDEGNEH